MDLVKKLTYPEESIVLTIEDPEVQNRVIKTLRKANVPVFFNTIEYDTRYPYLCWDGEEISQCRNLECMDNIDSEEEFLALFLEAKEVAVYKIQLNNEYVAEVTARGVLVGCQRISFDKVREVMEAIKRFEE